MRVLELNAEYLGVSLGTLMENAGREVSRVILSNQSIENKRIGIVCGTGGNGGDGFVAANPFHGVFLQNPKKFGLHRDRDISYFIDDR